MSLQLKAFETLCILLEHAGRLIKKEDLLRQVWPDTVVEENNLNKNVSMLRKALGEHATGQSYIETVPRVGYRFIASVTKIAASPSVPAQDISAIGVLPFVDMSPGHDQYYLCEGLAEELINSLAQVDGLRVAARTASFQFRSSGADLRAVGQQLRVGTVLEGSVRKSDNRLRVTVQLIDVATGYHRWSQRFDRTLDDIFAIQDEIAESTVASLRGSILSAREKDVLLQPHTDPTAYECYLRGVLRLHRMTHSDLETSREMFERAIEQEANYSPALASLAMVHATLYEWFGAGEDDLVRAERASQRALKLNPGLAEAHVARGCSLSLCRHYEEAAKEFEKAIRLNPNLFDAHYYFARTSFARGDVGRSADLFSRAAETRLEDFQSPLLRAQSLRMLGRVEEAQQAMSEGIHRAEHSLLLNPRDGRALSLGSCALFAHGQKARAMEWSERSLTFCPDDLSTLANAACLNAKAGQKEEALALVERLFARGWGKRDWVERDPSYDSVRNDPRFQKVLAKLK